jgi:pimeloyl-ACP methyl ester carboxylesterase
MSKQLMICLAILSATIFCGCEDNAAYMTSDRLNSGLVVILPGIEGESDANQNIRHGLNNAGTNRSMQIWHWGRPVPGFGMILNQVDFLGNYIAGERIAQRIVEYQSKHPNNPVHIIGHSGGGGIAVFAAASMPKGKTISGVILLSASISSNHDITRALNNCSSGIVNFYNSDDVVLLGLATTVLGNVGGSHGPSAGLSGFNLPKTSASDDKQLAYQKLYQVPMSNMVSNASAHFAATEPSFVSSYIAPWVASDNWPADPNSISKLARDSGAEVLVFTNDGELTDQ